MNARDEFGDAFFDSVQEAYAAACDRIDTLTAERDQWKSVASGLQGRLLDRLSGRLRSAEDEAVLAAYRAAHREEGKQQ